MDLDEPVWTLLINWSGLNIWLGLFKSFKNLKACHYVQKLYIVLGETLVMNMNFAG